MVPGTQESVSPCGRLARHNTLHTFPLLILFKMQNEVVGGSNTSKYVYAKEEGKKLDNFVYSMTIVKKEKSVNFLEKDHFYEKFPTCIVYFFC